MKISHTLSAAIVMLLLTIAPLHAGTVSSFGGASGPGLASLSFNNIFFSTPNNDDVVGASPNLIDIHQKDIDRLDVIDLVFNVTDSGGVTEYMLSEGVNNSSGVPWTDYHLQLGFGTGVDYVKSLPFDGLDFDAPDYNSPYNFSPPFGTVIPSEDDITIFGGTFPNLAFFVFQFPIDVPDGIDSFTVRQYPTVDGVPEPSTAILALLICCVLPFARNLWK